MTTAPNHLRCEYFTSPLGIDAREPRLAWQLTDARQGARQSAFHILVATSIDALKSDRGDLWDSGKVDSDQSVHVVYRGSSLKSRQRCWWKVRTWDADGQPSAWSEPAFWEMGLLARDDWNPAKWIAADIVGGPYTIPPAAYLRKTFTVRGPVTSARLYITALGTHEFQINGKPAHDAIFAPGRTEYTRRVPYHTFDVTSLIQPGENACGAILGDGWYCGHLHSDPRQTFGDRPRLLAQLHITLADGSTQQIVSDESWTSGEGPIRSSDMLMGEDYDARLEIPGWSTTSPGKPTGGKGAATSSASKDNTSSQAQSFNAQNLEFFLPGHAQPPVRAVGIESWRPVIVFDDPGIEINAHPAPPIRATQEVKPIAAPVASANKRRHLFDLGQNMVGRVRLRIRNASPGMVIDLRHVEMLDNGKPYTTALRSARATDHYTTRGGAEEFFEPHFTFHGFRYVEVRDYPGRNPTADDVTGIVLHSDLDRTGEFECSNEMINQLQRNIVWSQRGNFLDFPTDCPQRDERLGWTGDAQVFIRTAAFNMNVAGFFTKWLQDMEDSQGDDGRIPSVVPHVVSIHDEGGPAWADAAVICPWVVYQCYGDTRIIQQCWPMMTRFMEYLKANCKNYIRADEHWKWKGYGDWLNMNAETPADLIGTAFYAYCAQLMSKMATAVGARADAEQYRQLAENVRQAWQKRFITSNGELSVKTQTAYVLGLHFDLLPTELRSPIAVALVHDIEQRGMHLSTGFVGTPYLNLVLTAAGRTDVAYALLTQKTFPSWLFPITHGATTMWERWDGWTPEKGFNDAGMNSYNHYAYGAVGEWMYKVIGGIDFDPEKPGYKHIRIRPQPGGGMTWAKTALMSSYGRIATSWTIDGGKFHLDVTIPPNATATVTLPGNRGTSEIGAGSYSFDAQV
jgi:alpha-L-rhamnosidase